MLLSAVIYKISSKQNPFLLPFPPSTHFPLSFSSPFSSFLSLPPLSLPPNLCLPSLVLDRVRSFNLYRYRSGNIPLESATPSNPLETLPALLDQAIATVSEAMEAIHTPKVDPAGEEHYQFSKSQSEPLPAVGEEAVKLDAKMMKSASDLSMFMHIKTEEAEVVLRSAMMRPRIERQEAKAEEEEEDDDDDDEGGEVDAHTDDFINQFQQQLKLQQLNSIMRYKEISFLLSSRSPSPPLPLQSSESRVEIPLLPPFHSPPPPQPTRSLFLLL